MSLLINPGLPKVSPTTVAIGAIYSHATSFVIQRPILGAVFKKAQTSQFPKEVFESKEAQTAITTIATSAASSAVTSYGIAALLHLANVNNYKGAAVVGTLVLAAQSGPQLIQNVLLSKEPWDVILSTLAVKVLDTVGLALTLQWYNKGFISEEGHHFVSSINKKLN